MESEPSVMVIMGSTRAGRLCPKITDWVIGVGRNCTPFQYQLADLCEWSLPMDDEPAIPAAGGGYSHEHTQAWSDAVSNADGIVIVTPQYNWGYPAPLKNAIDHLYEEWRGKPLLIVSYGGHGGSKCAEQLKQVAAAVNMRVAEGMPALVLSEGVIHGAELDPTEHFKDEVIPTEQAFATFAALFGDQVTIRKA